MTIVASGTTDNQYIEGRIDYSTSILSDGKIRVTAILQMRRNNYPDYTGNTGGDYCTKAICISGDSGNFNYSGGTPLWIYGSDQNNWVEKFRATRDFDASRGGGQIYLGWKTEGNSYISGSRVQQITLPQGYTDPSGLNVSVNSVGTNSANLYVSLSSYGNPSSANNRYIEAAVLNQNSYGATYRYAIAFNTTSANINVTNDGGGTLNIQPNTRYYYGAYASNTQRSINTVKGTLVTLPPALSSKTATTTGTNSIRINYSTAADGGYYSKSIEYNTGDGWKSGATVGSSGTSSGSFTISGLSTGTNYTINLRVKTSAGVTSSGSVSATTYEIPANATVSASNASSTSNTVTYGVSTFNIPSSGTVYLFGGTSASPSGDASNALASKTTTGNSNYTHSGLAGNTRYYYRARAYNSGGWSAYSSDATAITRPANPTITINSLGHHTVSLSINSPSQGSASTMTAYYKVDGGSVISAGTMPSGGSKTVQLSFDPQTPHTVTAYLSNSSGNSGEASSTFTTKIPFYAPVSGQSRMAKKLYCSVNGEAKKVQHLYASVNGVAKKIF